MSRDCILYWYAKFQKTGNNNINIQIFAEGHLKRLPNQELSGAKSELQGGTVGVCSSYKRRGQPPYNLHSAHLWFTPRSLQVCLFAHLHLRIINKK